MAIPLEAILAIPGIVALLNLELSDLGRRLLQNWLGVTLLV